MALVNRAHSPLWRRGMLAPRVVRSGATGSDVFMGCVGQPNVALILHDVPEFERGHLYFMKGAFPRYSVSEVQPPL